MLALFQRFLPHAKPPLPAFGWLEAWAHLRGDELKRVRSQAGFVLSNRFHEREMRIECGASQRDYIVGNEVRLRYELGLPKHCEMLILSRGLAERLEQRTFDTLTQGDQTEVTAALPEEARWLALFERVDLSGLPPALAKRFVIVAAQPALARQWLEGELSTRLSRAASRWLGPEMPFVAITLRGRLYVRADAHALDQPMLDGLRGIADAAGAQALKLFKRRSSTSGSDAGQSTVPGRTEDADPSRFDASKDELRMLDEAIRHAASVDLGDTGSIDATHLRETSAVPHAHEAIDGLSVVICESPSLPALVFQEPADEPLPSVMDEDMDEPSALDRPTPERQRQASTHH